MNFWDFFKNCVFSQNPVGRDNSQSGFPIILKLEIYILVAIRSCCIVLWINPNRKINFYEFILDYFLRNRIFWKAMPFHIVAYSYAFITQLKAIITYITKMVI